MTSRTKFTKFQVFVIAMLFTLGVAFGCDQKVETTYELGDKVSAEQVINALADAASFVPYDQSQKDEWVSVEHTATVPGAEPQIQAYTDFHTLAREISEDVLTLTFASKQFDAERNLKKEVEFDVQLAIQQGLKNFRNKQSPQGDKTTFHELRTYSSVVPAPREWAEKPNCGDIPKCQLNTQVVEFDFASQPEDGDPTVIHYEIHYTNAITPYWTLAVLNFNIGPFPGHVKACLSTIMDDGNRQSQPVKICETVVDMIMKQP